MHDLLASSGTGNVAQILQKYLVKIGAKLSATGSSFDVDGENMCLREIADEAWLDSGGKLSNKAFQVALEKMCRNLRSERNNRAKAEVLNVPKNDGAELEKFIRLIAHKDTDDRRMMYYIVAFRQLIWQVKRRMRDLPTSWEIMVCLHSSQGSGKSSAAAKFGRVIGPLFMPMADFTLFSDKFRVRQLQYYYLVCLDEMGRASKTDINTVKQVITAPTVQARGIYSAGENHVPRNANFIATSNKPITASLTDTTGMRRFVEVRCRDEAYTDSWGKMLNSIDFAAIWACETGEKMAPASTDEARAIMSYYQGEIHTISDFDYFVNTCLIKTDDPENRLKNRELYEKYATHCGIQRRAPLSIQVFAREMKCRFPMIKPGNAVVYTNIKQIDE